MNKIYNMVHGVNHKYVDADVNNRQIAAICGCNHLTPRLEAEMENLIAKRRVSFILPKDEEIASQNTPGYKPPPRYVAPSESSESDSDSDWMDTSSGPSRDDIERIEAETRVTC